MMLSNSWTRCLATVAQDLIFKKAQDSHRECQSSQIHRKDGSASSIILGEADSSHSNLNEIPGHVEYSVEDAKHWPQRESAWMRRNQASCFVMGVWIRATTLESVSQHILKLKMFKSPAPSPCSLDLSPSCSSKGTQHRAPMVTSFVRTKT